MVLQPITAIFEKLIKHHRCPVGTVHLVAVIEERVGPAGTMFLECLVEMCQIMSDGFSIIMVEHIAFTARCSSLDSLHGMSVEDGNDAPLSCWGIPFQCVATDKLRHVDHLVVLIRHHLVEGRIAFGAGHVEREWGGAIRCQHVGLGNQFAGSFRQWYPWSAERPPRATVHVDVHACGIAHLLCLLQGVHPVLAQVAQFVLRIVLHTIDRCNLQGADARLGIFPDIVIQILVVNGRPHPPPATASLCLAIYFGP